MVMGRSVLVGEPSTYIALLLFCIWGMTLNRGSSFATVVTSSVAFNQTIFTRGLIEQTLLTIHESSNEELSLQESRW